MTDPACVIIQPLLAYTRIEGCGTCWKGGRVYGCSWLQVSKCAARITRASAKKCQEPNCHEPGLHYCASGKLICCQHCVMFGVLHQTPWNSIADRVAPMVQCPWDCMSRKQCPCSEGTSPWIDAWLAQKVTETYSRRCFMFEPLYDVEDHSCLSLCIGKRDTFLLGTYTNEHGHREFYEEPCLACLFLHRGIQPSKKWNFLHHMEDYGKDEKAEEERIRRSLLYFFYGQVFLRMNIYRALSSPNPRYRMLCREYVFGRVDPEEEHPWQRTNYDMSSSSDDNDCPYDQNEEEEEGWLDRMLVLEEEVEREFPGEFKTRKR